jgi:hypothetical protein
MAEIHKQHWQNSGNLYKLRVRSRGLKRGRAYGGKICGKSEVAAHMRKWQEILRLPVKSCAVMSTFRFL